MPKSWVQTPSGVCMSLSIMTANNYCSKHNDGDLGVNPSGETYSLNFKIPFKNRY